jgi:Na+(H+)/acetate symporter ActP
LESTGGNQAYGALRAFRKRDGRHGAVCGGKVSLAAAQNAIAADWLTAESKLGLAGRASTRT